METTKETQQKHYDVDVRNIQPLNKGGGNIRVDYGDLDELAQSIEENGIKVPMRAYRDKQNEGKWIAIDGHRRLAASMKLYKEKGIVIRAKVIAVDYRTLSEEQLIYDMFVTNMGKQLNILEQAEGVRRLINHGIPKLEIARKIGNTKRYINNLELLSLAPKKIRDMIASNKISATLVISTLKNTEDFNEAIQIIESGLGIAKANKRSGDDLPADAEEAFAEDQEMPGIKVTARHINKAMNKVDSIKELVMVFKSATGKDKKLRTGNEGIYTFAKRLIENSLTKDAIENLLYEKQ